MTKRAGILFVGLYLSGGAVAHHSAYVHFDNTDVVDITGELTRVEWRNPHIRFVVRSLDENGEEIEWLV
jgi:hypothetical protein